MFPGSSLLVCLSVARLSMRDPFSVERHIDNVQQQLAVIARHPRRWSTNRL